MGILILVQIALNLSVIAAITWLLVERAKSRRGDDPRISRALQMITSKIAILQDTMDRAETAARQIDQLIEKKQSDIQDRIEESDVFLHKLKDSMEKSKELATIFQDKIPHQEIIERQKSIKYLQVAKLSNAGLGVDEIMNQVKLPRAEVELIAKINREKLVVEKPPAWATDIIEKTQVDQTSDNGSFESNYSSQNALEMKFSNSTPDSEVSPVLFRRFDG